MNMVDSQKAAGLPQLDQTIVCVVGLGYVGLPLAKAFSKAVTVIGFDINTRRIDDFRRRTELANIAFTTDPADIGKADFIIICVPTPVTKSKQPDLSYIRSAAKTVGQNIKKGSIVILESTVYPGVTEEVVKPILEESGLKCGEYFRIAYCPERINPGDDEHAIQQVTKVVSGMDKETAEAVAELYRNICPNICMARNIKTAEAAKVIENIQRDLNIALINELSLIFEKMDLNIRDVLKTAATKWNFHVYLPGLVGGHCIPVDPYYLVYKAEELGYHPEVILAGRSINDRMPKHVSEITIKALNNAGKVLKGSKVLIMGLSYKENVSDTRETPVKGIIKELKEYGVEITGCCSSLIEGEDDFGIEILEELSGVLKFDGVILTVGHDAFRSITLDILRNMMTDNPVLIDVRGFYDREEAERKGFLYKTL